MFEDVRYINVEKLIKLKRQLKSIYWNVYSECILILASSLVNVIVTFVTRQDVTRYYSWISETNGT